MNTASVVRQSLVVARERVCALWQKSVEMSAPTGRVSPSRSPCAFAAIEYPLDATPYSARCFRLREPDRRQKRQDHPECDIGKSPFAKGRAISVTQCRLPLCAVLVVPEATFDLVHEVIGELSRKARPVWRRIAALGSSACQKRVAGGGGLFSGSNDRNIASRANANERGLMLAARTTPVSKDP